MESIMEGLAQLIAMFAGKWPWLAGVIFTVGSLRLIFKPAMSIVRVITELTPSKHDDDLADRIEANKIVKTILYVLDWLTSIKLNKKK